jgi:uncharacterized protein with PQ loop repeat
LQTRSELIGYVCGCISGLLYFTSRIPQIKANYKRKSTEGLEPLMFVMAVLGNLLYAAGVLTKGVSTELILIRFVPPEVEMKRLSVQAVIRRYSVLCGAYTDCTVPRFDWLQVAMAGR